MNTRLENIVVSGLVAAAISVSISGAASPPINTNPTPRASLNDRFTALQKRVDALQNSDAATRQNLRSIVNAVNDTATQAQEASDQAACITAGYQVAFDDQGALVANNDEPSPANFIVATVDPECAA